MVSDSGRHWCREYCCSGYIEIVSTWVQGEWHYKVCCSGYIVMVSTWITPGYRVSDIVRCVVVATL